jgi:hypothetical protein
MCENGIPGAWSVEWQVDANGDGVVETIIPFAAGVNESDLGVGGYSNVHDPNYLAWPSIYTNDTRCVDFVVDPGETMVFQIDNSYPGGEPRTIGFWKNWNRCTGGRQWETAEENGGADEGWYILDDLLNDPGYHFGDPLNSGNQGLQLDGDLNNFLLFRNGIGWKGKTDCQAGVLLLDKSDIVSGKKAASDPAFNLAAQLFAAVLNYSAGAEQCNAATTAMNQGKSLLTDVHFNGTGSYRTKGATATQMNTVARTLDQYNNGNLCP